jgi:hypothetical protein
MEISLLILTVIQMGVCAVMGAKLSASRFDNDVLKSYLKIAQDVNYFSQIEINNLRKQYQNTDFSFTKTKLDDQTQKLLRLAIDPSAGENEARNAAMQVCKRLARKK